MTAWMNFKIGCCETILVHFCCLIYNVSRTVEMPNLQDWEGRQTIILLCLQVSTLLKSPVFLSVSHCQKYAETG